MARGLLADWSRQWRDIDSVDLDGTSGPALTADDPEVVEFIDQLSTLSDP